MLRKWLQSTRIYSSWLIPLSGFFLLQGCNTEPAQQDIEQGSVDLGNLANPVEFCKRINNRVEYENRIRNKNIKESRDTPEIGYFNFKSTEMCEKIKIITWAGYDDNGDKPPRNLKIHIAKINISRDEKLRVSCKSEEGDDSSIADDFYKDIPRQMHKYITLRALEKESCFDYIYKIIKNDKNLYKIEKSGLGQGLYSNTHEFKSMNFLRNDFNGSDLYSFPIGFVIEGNTTHVNCVVFDERFIYDNDFWNADVLRFDCLQRL